MAKFLGRTLNFGIAREVTTGRGTAEADADFWVPLKSYALSQKVDKAIDESPTGSIEPAGKISILREYVSGDVSVQLGVDSLGLLFYALFGTCGTDTDSPEAGVQTHSFTVLQTVQHPSLTLFKKDGAFQRSFTFGMVNTFGLNVDIGADEHLSADINFIASQEEASATNPNYDAETVFVPRMANVKIAATRAALDAATPLCVKNISINFNKKAQGDYTFCGGGSMDDINNLDFEVNGSIELNLEDTTYRDYVLDNDSKALRIEIEDTSTTIGAATHPRIRIDLPLVYFIDWEETIDFTELGKQTIGFIARKKAGDKIARAEIINTHLSYWNI